MIPEVYDLTGARAAILGDFRSQARLYLAFGTGVLVFSAISGALYLGRFVSGMVSVALLTFAVLFGLLAAVWLVAAAGLYRSAPSKLSITSEGLRFEYPSGRGYLVAWEGRPRPFESEPVICDIWQRPDHDDAIGSPGSGATIAMCPPYPRKTRFSPAVGLSSEALTGILRAAESRGHRVTKERLEGSRLPGFGTKCAPGSTHWRISPRKS